MGYLKRFSDILGGVAAFFAGVFLFGKYMEYDPANVGEGKSKLAWFFSSNNASEYRQYLVLIGLIALTVAIGFILKKHPEASLVVSVLPLCHAMAMLYRDLFYEYSYFYVAVCALMFCANLYETATADKADGKRRTVLGARITGILASVLTIVSLVANKMAIEFGKYSIDDGVFEAQANFANNVKPFGILLYSEVPENEGSTLILIAIALAVCVLVCWNLRRAYFVDALLAFVPFILSVAAIHAEKITTAPMLVVVPAAAYFICCISLVWRES